MFYSGVLNFSCLIFLPCFAWFNKLLDFFEAITFMVKAFNIGLECPVLGMYILSGFPVCRLANAHHVFNKLSTNKDNLRYNQKKWVTLVSFTVPTQTVILKIIVISISELANQITSFQIQWNLPVSHLKGCSRSTV